MPKLTRITRSESLTPEEAKRYQEVRTQIDQELPELIKRHHDRMAVEELKIGNVYGSLGKLIAIHSVAGERTYFFDKNGISLIPGELIASLIRQ